MPTASCNNHASPSIEYTVQAEFDQEKDQERLNDVKKFLQDQGSYEGPPLSHMFDSNQNPRIPISPETTETSSLALVSEFGWAPLAEISKVPDNGEQLAQLVAAKDPSGALVSDLGWPDVYINEKQPTNAIDDTPLTSYSHNGGLDTAEITNNSTGGPSLTSCQVHSNQTVTLTGLPVVSATSLDESRGQLLEDALLAMASEASSSLEAHNSSLGTSIRSLGNNNSSPGTNISLTATNNSRICQGLQVTNYLPGGPITEAACTRPSVIVSKRSPRKRAFKEINDNAEKKLILEKNLPVQNLMPDHTMDDDQEETNGSAGRTPMVEKNSPAPIFIPDLSMDDDQDEVSPAVLEKRKKANARCRKYRINK